MTGEAPPSMMPLLPTCTGAGVPVSTARLPGGELVGAWVGGEGVGCSMLVAGLSAAFSECGLAALAPGACSVRWLPRFSGVHVSCSASGGMRLLQTRHLYGTSALNSLLEGRASLLTMLRVHM